MQYFNTCELHLKGVPFPLTDYCSLQITDGNKIVIKETVEVVAPARISTLV